MEWMRKEGEVVMIGVRTVREKKEGVECRFLDGFFEDN